MPADLIELQARRAKLVERIGHQRMALSRDLAPVGSALRVADRAAMAVQGGVQYLKANPLPLALVVVAVVVVRPRRALAWARQGLGVWRSWRSLQAMLPAGTLRQVVDAFRK